MIRLKDTRYDSPDALFSSAVKIAEYYGFAPIESVPRAIKEKGPPGPEETSINFARKDERVLLVGLKRAMACMRPAHGTLLTWRLVQATGVPASATLELQVLGSSSPMTEALLIVVAQAIMEEAGMRDRVLSINNIGSAESSGRYVRDIGTYLRKHIESIHPTLRERLNEDPLGTLVQLIERGHPAISRAPQAMEYLNEEERRRFWELLEHLESFGLPYELNGQILGSRDCWSNSLFQISSIDPETGLQMKIAEGGRTDPLASRVKKGPEHGATLSITCEAAKKPEIEREAGSPPGLYFAQLGHDARRTSLSVLESLRRAGIATHQGIWYERIAEQMAAARALAVPYILIMGHKETMEGTVLVREVATNSQVAVPVSDLAGYLRRRRLSATATAFGARN